MCFVTPLLKGRGSRSLRARSRGNHDCSRILTVLAVPSPSRWILALLVHSNSFNCYPEGAVISIRTLDEDHNQQPQAKFTAIKK